MVDNITVTPGSGASVAADDISGVLVQRVKTTWGPDGTMNDADIATGKPMPVQIRSATGLIPWGEPTDTASVVKDTTSATLVALTKGLISILGEVQASPTSNTLLERTKAVTTAITAATITAGTQASPSTSYLSVVGAGDIAHDAVDSGNPVKIGGKAIAGLSTATLVAAADRTQLHIGLDGAIITRPHGGLEDIVTGNATNTDGTATQCIAAQSAGIKTYLTSIVLCNTSATAITVDIKDGSTVKVSLPLPAGSGCVFNPPVPIPGTAATAWNFDGSAAATTVTCSMIGFKSKV